MPPTNLQRLFAILELLGAVAAFMFAHFAVTVGANPTIGTGIALWIGLGLAVGGAAIAVLIYLLGRARPQTPQLDRFLTGKGPAWYSPPLLATVRNSASTGALAQEPSRP